MTGVPREFSLLYVTCPSETVALRIAEALVTDRLAACGNVFPGMKSVYVWKAELTHDDEVVLILKTRQALVSEATKAVLALHPYEVPCVVELPLESGNPDFLDFLRGGTRSP